MQVCRHDKDNPHWEFTCNMAGGPVAPETCCKRCLKDVHDYEKLLAARLQGQRQEIISRRATTDADQFRQCGSELQGPPLEQKLDVRVCRAGGDLHRISEECLKSKFVMDKSATPNDTFFDFHQSIQIEGLEPVDVKKRANEPVQTQGAGMPAQVVPEDHYYYFNYKNHPMKFFESEQARNRLKDFFEQQGNAELKVLSVEAAEDLNDWVDLFGLLNDVKSSGHDCNELRSAFVLCSTEKMTTEDLRLKLLDFEESEIKQTGKQGPYMQPMAMISAEEAGRPWVIVGVGNRPVRMSRMRSPLGR